MKIATKNLPNGRRIVRVISAPIEPYFNTTEQGESLRFRVAENGKEFEISLTDEDLMKLFRARQIYAAHFPRKIVPAIDTRVQP